MNCWYCQGPVLFNTIEGVNECDACVVQYHTSETRGDLHIKWCRDIGTAKWALNIYPARNITYLSGYFPDKEHFYDEITINQILVVNKDNVIQKIKTILTFQ